MTPEFERYDYRHLVGSPASGSEKEFDAERFDELLTDDDRKLLQLRSANLVVGLLGHQHKTVPSSLSSAAIHDDAYSRTNEAPLLDHADVLRIRARL
jgi:hypothetical protein